MAFGVGYPGYCPGCEIVYDLHLGADESPEDRECPECGTTLQEVPEDHGKIGNIRKIKLR